MSNQSRILTGCCLLVALTVAMPTPRAANAAEPSSRSPRPRVVTFGAAAESADGEFHVGLLGEVASPGVYAVPRGMTFQQLVQAAGGLTDDAGMSCSLVRNQRGGQRFAWDPNGRDPLQPNDVILIASRGGTTSAGSARAAAVRPAALSSNREVIAADCVWLCLLGLVDRPVIVKIRPHEADPAVLAQKLGQSSELARQFRLVDGPAGRSPTASQGLPSGSILAVPPRMIDHGQLPELPPVVAATAPPPLPREILNSARSNSSGAVEQYAAVPTGGYRVGRSADFGPAGQPEPEIGLGPEPAPEPARLAEVPRYEDEPAEWTDRTAPAPPPFPLGSGSSRKVAANQMPFLSADARPRARVATINRGAAPIPGQPLTQQAIEELLHGDAPLPDSEPATTASTPSDPLDSVGETDNSSAATNGSSSWSLFQMLGLGAVVLAIGAAGVFYVRSSPAKFYYLMDPLAGTEPVEPIAARAVTSTAIPPDRQSIDELGIRVPAAAPIWRADPPGPRHAELQQPANEPMAARPLNVAPAISDSITPASNDTPRIWDPSLLATISSPATVAASAAAVTQPAMEPDSAHSPPSPSNSVPRPQPSTLDRLIRNEVPVIEQMWVMPSDYDWATLDSLSRKNRLDGSAPGVPAPKSMRPLQMPSASVEATAGESISLIEPSMIAAQAMVAASPNSVSRAEFAGVERPAPRMSPTQFERALLQLQGGHRG